MDHKVSIVVPVYGVEKYIAECIESLSGQTYENLEIILVDDGGKDRSVEICEQYAAQDERIRVIRKTNGGAASARNVGINEATGEYLCFVDGDDKVEKNYVSHLWKTLTQANADIAVCGLYYWTKDTAGIVPIEAPGIYHRDEYLSRFISHWTCSLMTNKLFKRSTIGTVRFEEGHCIDDEFFTYLVVMNCQRVAVTDASLYGYRMRGSSVMQDMGPHLERVMLDRIEYITTRYRNIAQRIPNMEQEFFRDTLDTITRYWTHSKNMPEAQKRIRRWVKEHTKRIITVSLPWHIRLAYLKQLYIKKPAVMSEPNHLQMDAGEYFD
jgi:glycosyltransferase involved in cell wall biosynthesis